MWFVKRGVGRGGGENWQGANVINVNIDHYLKA